MGARSDKKKTENITRQRKSDAGADRRSFMAMFGDLRHCLFRGRVRGHCANKVPLRRKETVGKPLV